MKKSIPVMTAAVLCLSLVGIGGAGATFRGANGKIAYSTSGRARGIYLQRPGSSIARRLTKGADTSPVFSPGGGRIAFLRTTQPAAGVFKTHVYVMRTDGTRVRRVSRRIRGMAQTPVWSPDGKWIVFEDFILGTDAGGNETYRGALKKVRPDGSGRKRLTGFRSRNAHPTWAPSSRRLAFASDRDGDFEIFVMRGDGSRERKLTNNDVIDETPHWSLAGRGIVYAHTIPQGTQSDGVAIHVIQPDGSGDQALTDGSRFDQVPQWSPDGSKIAFNGTSCTGQNCEQDLWVMRADGSNERNLTANYSEAVDFTLVWSPDSRKIAWGTGGNLYVTTVATGEVAPLTTNPGEQRLGDWQAR